MDSRFERLKTVFEGELKFDVSMSEMTGWKLGGPAAVIASPKDIENLVELVDYLRAAKIDYRPLGDGTNLLVRDGGYDGVLIKLSQAFEGIELLSEDESSVLLRVGSATPTMRLVRYASENGLSGLEMLAGIPGRIGGAIYGNAGSAVRSVSEVIETVELIDRKPKVSRRSKDACGFDYRNSKFAYKEIITAVDIKLGRGNRSQIAAEIDRIRSEKREKQPLDKPSCGSVFKNPPGRIAAEMIDGANLKGVRVRQAQISEKHANFIVNLGGATANDVLALINLIRDRVKTEFGLGLDLEVQVIGHD